MKDFKRYEKVIAIAEKSVGNAQVGDMWLNAKSFSPDTPIKDIIDWAKPNASGRLIITIDEKNAEY